MHAARSDPRDAHHRGWSPGRDRNHDPQQRREAKSSQGHDFQEEGRPGSEVANYAKRQEKKGGGKRGQYNQREVDGAVPALPYTTVFAGGKVMLVVLAHFWRDAGDVVPP